MATNAEIKRFIKEVRQEQDRRNNQKFATKAEVASAFILRGSVSSFDDLPANPTAGDVYNIATAGGTDMHGNAIKAGDNIVYTADGGWDVLAGTFDTTSFASNFETQIAGLSADISALETTVGALSTAVAGNTAQIGALSTAVNATFSTADLTYIFTDE